MKAKNFPAVAASVLTACLGTMPAFATDDYNIDFGDLSLGTPITYGGAAAKPGVWNIINTIGTVPLVDTSGSSTSVLLSIGFGYGFGSDGNYSGPHADLLDDMLWGQSASTGQPDWDVTIRGLPTGTYAVYYYAPVHPMPTGNVSINGVPATLLPGDAYETNLVNGINWAVYTVNTPAGAGVIRITGTNDVSGTYGMISGIAGLQIAKRDRVVVPPPPGC